MADKPEVVPQEALAAFNTYVPPPCGACGKGTTLRVACPDCGNSKEVPEDLFKRFVAVIEEK